MIRALIFLILIFTAYSLQSPASYAESLSSNELIERAKELDGKPVSYKGEAVTAILNRGEYSWVNLNDGYNAIGIWCESRQLRDVKFLGDYKNKGDILEINGIFNHACPVHNGELDIHADKVVLVKSGFPVKETISTKKTKLSIYIFLVTLLVIVLFNKRRT